MRELDLCGCYIKFVRELDLCGLRLFVGCVCTLRLSISCLLPVLHIEVYYFFVCCLCRVRFVVEHDSWCGFSAGNLYYLDYLHVSFIVTLLSLIFAHVSCTLAAKLGIDV